MDAPWTEDQRLRALHAYRVLDTEAEPAFDDIADMAAELLGAPISAISLVDAERQWFKASVGLDVRETDRAVSFCDHAMWSDDVFVIPDARNDERFRDNALVTGDLGIRFYAGVPLRAANGAPLGALCVIDTKPRDGLTETQARLLRMLARQVTGQLELRATLAREKEREQWFRAIADSMPQMVWSTRPDGFHDYYNRRWYDFTGVPDGSTDGEGWNGMFHPDDQARAWRVWEASLQTGAPYQIEYRLRRHDGAYRWVLGRALPVQDAEGAITRWFGTCTDIHDAKEASERNDLLSRELGHRIKNIFSVVGGLIALGSKSFPEAKAYAAALSDRVVALGRAHDFIRPQGASTAPRTLGRLTTELFKAYNLSGERVVFGGQDLAVDERSATALSLVFHELATNAAKYGALSMPHGRVDLRCEVADADAVLTWRESGGPPVETPPIATGFGSTLVRLSVEGQLAGALDRQWSETGLVVRLRAPLANIGQPVQDHLRDDLIASA
jgi:PAS domain S-box-containing protein